MPHQDLGIGPGAPHTGYDTEMAAGVAANGYRETVRFRPSEFSQWDGHMDGVDERARSGNDRLLAGLHVRTDHSQQPLPNPRHGCFHPQRCAVFNVFEGDVPALDSDLDPPFDVDGHSHFPFFLADNSDFGPPHTQVNGSYRWDVTMRDSGGNGWDIEVDFLIGGWGNQ